MATTDPSALALALLAGLALGAFFYGSLWWSVRQIVASTRPALVQLASFVTRMAVTLLGFHLVGGADAARIVACLAGFVIARLVAARWARVPAPAATATEASHATRP